MIQAFAIRGRAIAAGLQSRAEAPASVVSAEISPARGANGPPLCCAQERGEVRICLS